jgi:hypothetical protein
MARNTITIAFLVAFHYGIYYDKPKVRLVFQRNSKKEEMLYPNLENYSPSHEPDMLSNPV